ncbi:MAG: hypothetical protein EXR72_22165 [Myxococcales bacterium]|nr:hypothetical protein [Myxococcales bacterium]
MGPIDPAISRGAFTGAREEMLLGDGQSIDSQRILDGVPGFLGQTREIFAKLQAPQQRIVVGYAQSLDPVLVQETVTLRDLKNDHDERTQVGSGSRAGGKAEARRATQEGIALRDQAVGALKDVIGRATPEWAVLEESVGTAETAEKLARGLTWLADRVIEIRKGASPEALAVMDATGLDARYSDEITQSANRVRGTAAAAAVITATETRVTQRRLDLQDGRVLHVVRKIYFAFRAANRRNPAILIPDLGAMASFFTPHRAATPEPPDADPIPPQ